jgi:hypothetical protein
MEAHRLFQESLCKNREVRIGNHPMKCSCESRDECAYCMYVRVKVALELDTNAGLVPEGSTKRQGAGRAEGVRRIGELPAHRGTCGPTGVWCDCPRRRMRTTGAASAGTASDWWEPVRIGELGTCGSPGIWCDSPGRRMASTGAASVLREVVRTPSPDWDRCTYDCHWLGKRSFRVPLAAHGGAHGAQDCGAGRARLRGPE